MKIGNYIIYPALIFLIIGIFVGLLILIATINIIKNKKNEKHYNKNFEITKWQRKHLCDYVKETIDRENYSDALYDYAEMLKKYMDENKYWVLDELLAIDEELVLYTTILLFEASKNKYIDDELDASVLILHAIDFINGGMDNPDYEDGKYPWIGDEIAELNNSDEMSPEEKKLLHLYSSTLDDLYCYFDTDLEKIPEKSSTLEFCKRISLDDFNNAYSDIYESIDILELKDETRDIIAKAFFNNIYALFGGIFDKDSVDYEPYVNEYRRYQIRALAAVIDNQLYSEVVSSIEI